jgi:hypothetical protein
MIDMNMTKVKIILYAVVFMIPPCWIYYKDASTITSRMPRDDLSFPDRGGEKQEHAVLFMLNLQSHRGPAAAGYGKNQLHEFC